jgi:hypothetical protein
MSFFRRSLNQEMGSNPKHLLNGCVAVVTSPSHSKPSKLVSGRFTRVARVDQNRPHERRLLHCIFPTHHECYALANAAIPKERTDAASQNAGRLKTRGTFRESRDLRVITTSTVNQALGRVCEVGSSPLFLRHPGRTDPSHSSPKTWARALCVSTHSIPRGLLARLR